MGDFCAPGGTVELNSSPPFTPISEFLTSIVSGPSHCKEGVTITVVLLALTTDPLSPDFYLINKTDVPALLLALS